MTQFTYGDKVIYTGSATHGRWADRRRHQTVGTVVAVYGLAGLTTTGDPIQYDVAFEDDGGTGGVNGANIRLTDRAGMRFPVGTRVRAERYHSGSELVGTVRNTCLAQFDGLCTVIEADGETYPVHVKTNTMTEIEEETEVTAQQFIGARPANQGPKYQTPFQVADLSGPVVVDGQGHTVATVDLDHDYVDGDDDSMARAIAEALNEKFGPETIVQEAERINPFVFVPRVLVKIEDQDLANDTGNLYFAYEVEPGRFWWATSLADAQEEVKHDRIKGWLVASGENLYDVRDPNGAEVVTAF